MSAPALSPTERATVDRFEFADIIEHADDTVPCQIRDCDHAADIRVLCSGCRSLKAVACMPCYDRNRAESTETKFRCKVCRQVRFGLDRAAIVVPL